MCIRDRYDSSLAEEEKGALLDSLKSGAVRLLFMPNFMSCSARSGMAMRKMPPAVNSDTR